MPVKQIGPRQPGPTEQQLIDRLVKEWKNPIANASQPVILEEHDSAKRLVHIYVVWDDWASLNAEERSNIILDAAQIVKSHNQSIDITVAMGLTPDEADRLRLDYR
jgi:hypothetical protein